jgi:hypothetical protein
VLETRQCCFKEFPNQCTECPEYNETRPDPTLQLVLQAGSAGIPYSRQYNRLATKECKLYHKRKVEYPE